MYSNVNFSIIFLTRKSKVQNKVVNIYVRINVGQQRTEFSVKRSILPKSWDPINKKVKGRSRESVFINDHLDKVYGRLMVCYQKLLENRKFITADLIKACYFGEDKQQKTLKQIIRYHNEKMVYILKPGSLKNYYTTEKYLNRFLETKYRSGDVYLEQLNYSFIQDFEFYLRQYQTVKRGRALHNNGLMKHMERLKRFVNLAIKMEWITKDPFKNYRLKYDKYERQYLNERELRIMEDTEFKTEKLEKVRDVFVFSCYTGLSYIDIKQLRVDQIGKGVDGKNWIFTRRAKTDGVVKVPVLPKAQQIIDKYKETEHTLISGLLLPVLSNQKMNTYLGEVAEICEIDKHITFHVARHTFATTVTLTNGVPIETVSKLLGHTNLATTQIYARVIETKISEDMENLLQRIQKKDLQLINAKGLL